MYYGEKLQFEFGEPGVGGCWSFLVVGCDGDELPHVLQVLFSQEVISCLGKMRLNAQSVPAWAQKRHFRGRRLPKKVATREECT